MNKLIYILLTLLCLASCKDEVESFVLQGDIASLHDDTLFIYGEDEEFNCIDTLVTHGSRFEYQFDADTIVPFWIHFPNQHREYIFADKDITVTIEGDSAIAGHLTIQGGEENALLQAFYAKADSLGNTDAILKAADSFICAHPYSPVSIFLLRKYFIDIPAPNLHKIYTLINSLSGLLQDDSYIRSILRFRDEQYPLNISNVVSDYSTKNIDGQGVYSSRYKDTYLLITFWASWDAESRMRQRELVAIQEKNKNRMFDILSISLDTHIDSCRQAIKEDGTTWQQVCDGKGWNGHLVKQMKVQQLPYNILINSYRRIQAINIYGDELDQFIKAKAKTKKPEKKYLEKKFKR